MVAASTRIYGISQGTSGLVVWNSSEAYFFVEAGELGYSASALEYPWLLFKQYVIGGFAAAALPNNQRADLVVIRVNSSGAERHVLKLDRTGEGGPGGDPSKYTPIEGRIYAFYPKLIGHFMQDGHEVGKDMNDGLGWWAGDHFEKATDDERQRLDGINRLTTADFDNDANGWSRRAFVAGPIYREFTVDVGGQFRVLVENVAKGTGNGTVSIDLLRPGKAPERIGDFDTRAGRISKSEYVHAFQGR